MTIVERRQWVRSRNRPQLKCIKQPVDGCSPPLRELTVPMPEPGRLKQFALKAAFIAVLLYLVYLTRDLWLPLGLAFLIAMVLDPVVDRMEARGWSRSWGTIFIYASFLLIS